MRLTLSADERFLEADLLTPHRTLSWAVIGGGLGQHSKVVWHFVRREELAEHTCPVQLFRNRLTERSYGQVVGLLTARYLAPFAQALRTVDGVSAHAVATVGMGNALRVGDAVHVRQAVGTINILCQVSVPLSDAGLIEALSIVVEARTAALAAFDVASVVSGEPATGTGTDCVVVACPATGDAQIYAGKHTAVGSAIGASVLGAMDIATKRWLSDDARVKVEAAHHSQEKP